MYLRLSMVTICVGASFSIALGQPAPIKTVPPALVAIWRVEEGILHFTETLTERKPVLGFQTFEVDGKKKQVGYTGSQVSHKQVWKYLFLHETKVMTAGGKVLREKEIYRRLKGGTIALFSADGRDIDEAYRKTLRKDTILIIGKCELDWLPKGVQAFEQLPGERIAAPKRIVDPDDSRK